MTLGFTQVLRRDAALSTAQREPIPTIHCSGEQRLNSINDIPDLSRIEADRTAVLESSFDLVEFLNSLEEMLCYRAASRNLQFQFIVAPDISQFVTTDINKLRQVLINLLNNAIKFTQYINLTLYQEQVHETQYFDRR